MASTTLFLSWSFIISVLCYQLMKRLYRPALFLCTGRGGSNSRCLAAAASIFCASSACFWHNGCSNLHSGFWMRCGTEARRALRQARSTRDKWSLPQKIGFRKESSETFLCCDRFASWLWLWDLKISYIFTVTRASHYLDLTAKLLSELTQLFEPQERESTTVVWSIIMSSTKEQTKEIDASVSMCCWIACFPFHCGGCPYSTVVTLEKEEVTRRDQ